MLGDLINVYITASSMRIRPHLAPAILRAEGSKPFLRLALFAPASYLIMPIGSGWEAEAHGEWEYN